MTNRRHVALSTISFMVCFAAWGLIAAFAPRFRETFHLTPSQTALLVAIPVLLGSLARIPMGILTDRFGGRAIFFILMAAVAIPVWIVPEQSTYSGLLMVAFLLGLAGSSFAIGVGYVSRWTPAERQGSALGVYGLGNIGQSAAVFLGPVIAAQVGMASVYHGVAVMLVIWAVAFGLLARNAPAPATAQRKGLGVMMEVLTREKLSWLLSGFYFLTFGGFVAFSIYLPTLLKDEFHLTPADAGFRTAGFVVLATLLRPLGGWLSDRIGGARVLSAVFVGVAPFALLMAWSSMIPFTVGALGCAALLGLGNGAVFKLVPQYFPAQTGTVTGLVGAMGGLGGFFPPLLLAFFRSQTGAIWPGFALLAISSWLLWWANHKVFVPRQQALDIALPADLRRTADRVQAGSWATLWTALLVAAIVVGSRNLQNFDPALVIYTFAVVFATWGVVYHYNVWLEKPPTRIYWDRGWELYRRRGVIRSLFRVSALAATHLAGQGFIAKRSRLRWWMHQCLFWGCMLAVAITFPLVFGWIHFRTLPGDQLTYVTYLFGFPMGSFRLHTVSAWLLFHGLDISALLVLAGIALSLWRRMTDKGARTLQQFGMDFLPIIMLFAISVTGLALTVSQEWLRGSSYSFLAILHAITVIAALLFLPFGKFFHIFQRPAQLGVKLYQEAGLKDPGAHCVRCGERFASKMHIDDLRAVLPQVGFDYATAGPAGHWQALCPACKRKSLSTAHQESRRNHVAKVSCSQEELKSRFGPHLNYTPPGGWKGESGKGGENLVKTHCCFCGQQCGIQLKVRDNRVTGFEPWEEFPFNRGMLCPKGVKRYMQGSHPDRLLDPLMRTPEGFRPAKWDEALDFTARRLRELQEKYGKDSVAVYGGASLTTEKSYLMGKFARVALGTRHIDYNGRLCMVSAGTAYKAALGVDRAPNPWNDISEAEVLFAIGANIGECAPITTDYIWRARDKGAKLIVADPRFTPIARNADLYLPVRPGTDLALLMGMLHVIIRDGLTDPAFIEAHTTGFEKTAESVEPWNPRRAAEVSGVAPEAIEKAAHWIGESRRAMLMHARGLEHQSKGVENCEAVIAIALATGNIGREGAGPIMVTGQGNGQGGREHGQKCDQLPGQRSLTDPAARAHVAGVWGISADDLPQPGYTAVEIMNAIHSGEIKGLLSICFNPLVSLPDANFTRQALEKLEFFGVIDFFLSETAAHADVVLAGSLQEEEEGVTANVEARVIHIKKAVDPPGNARADSSIICDLAHRIGRGQYFPFKEPREIFEELRRASQGGLADYYGITYEKIDQQMGVFWPCPTLDHPGTPRLFEDGHFFHPDGKARFMSLAWRDSGDPVDAEFSIYLTTGRVVSQYLSGTQTRRIGALVDQYPEPKLELHPRLAEQHKISSGDWVTVTSRRTAITLQAMVVRTIRPDTVFIPYHWPGGRSANRLTHRTLDPRSKIPEYKVSACRIEKAIAPGGQR